MPQAVDRFAADADGADIFGIGAWPIAGASQAHRAAAASPLREAADAPRSSPHACMTIWQPPEMPRPASTRATLRSGQAVPVPNTPAAAATTPLLPLASLPRQLPTQRRLQPPSPCPPQLPPNTRFTAETGATHTP